MALPVVGTTFDVRIFFKPQPTAENPDPEEMERSVWVYVTGETAGADEAIAKAKPIFEAAQPGVTYRVNSSNAGPRLNGL